MQPTELLQSKQADIEALCRKYAVRRLRLFGSALREDWNPATSDFDFLAEFEASANLSGLDQLIGFIEELESLLGSKVDVVDWEAARNPVFRRNAERAAVEVYAA